MEQIWLLGKITYKEGVRNRILLGILLVAILFSAFNLIFTSMFAFDLTKVAMDLGLSTVSLAGLAIIFFMGINLLARDFEKRTIYMVISRPIARWEYILGKYLGLAMMVGTSVVMLGLFVAVGVKAWMMMAPNYIPINYSWNVFILAIFYNYLALMIITAMAQLFTCLTSSSYLALLITGCAYFIGQNVEIVRKSFMDGPGMNRFFNMSVEIGTWLFPNLQAFDLKTTAGYGLPIDATALFWTAIYGISYIGIILVLAIFVFQRREIS